MSSLDNLTELYDRKTFMSLLANAVKAATNYQTKIALLLVDINRFHRINSVFGYDAGDEVLRKFAILLTNVCRPQDLVARIGDNTYAVILDGVMNTGHAELAAHKIITYLQSPFEFGDKRIYVDCTIGISVCPLHASNHLFLMKECESVLHEAKISNRKIGVSSTPEEDVIPDDFDIELALGDAVQNGELLVHYQPKISLDSGGVVGAEALLRWQHSSKGLIPPDYFIPIAERTGHIKPMTYWLLNTVLRQTAEWTEHWGPLTVSINVPPDFILMPDFKDSVHNAVNLWKNDSTNICFEIIERSLVMEPEKSFSALQELRDLGMSISIDDFGTGYSSLSYFERLPVDELKIDRSFVADIVLNKANRNIVKLIIDLAHAFDMEVVAEGVEDLKTVEILRGLGCDIVQGFYYARPMPNDVIKKWLLDYGLPDSYRNSSSILMP